MKKKSWEITRDRWAKGIKGSKSAENLYDIMQRYLDIWNYVKLDLKFKKGVNK